VAAIIRDQLDELDDATHGNRDMSDGGGNSVEHISIGAKSSPSTFQEFDEAHQGNEGFQHFRANLSQFMTSFLTANNIPLPDNKPVKFQPSDSVSNLLPLRPLPLTNYSSDHRVFFSYCPLRVDSELAA
jgi:hypothetical protein